MLQGLFSYTWIECRHKIWPKTCQSTNLDTQCTPEAKGSDPGSQ